MVRFALLGLLAVAGCASPNSQSEDVQESTGAETAPAPATYAGHYGAHENRQWDGDLTISNETATSFDFAFEIYTDDPADEDDKLAEQAIGRIGGTATKKGDTFVSDDGGCAITFGPAPSGSKPHSIFVDANITCGLDLFMENHMTSQTAFDISATWSQ